MRQYILLEGFQDSLLKKIGITLLLICLALSSIPASVFGAEKELECTQTYDHVKKQASLDLSNQTQNFVSIADANQKGLDISGDMTISLWVKPTTLSGNMPLVSKWNHVTQTSYLLFIENGNIGLHVSSVGSGFGYGTFYAPYTKNANEWVNISMVYTASHGTAEIFVNGSSVGKSADFVMPTSIANTDAQFMIGTREGAISNYAGKIDEVHIWSRALLSAQVAQLYLHPKKSNNTAQLQGYWKFNGNLKDESSNANNLSPNGVFSNDVPFSVGD